MDENYLLKTKNAEHLYFETAQNLPIIDFHNHISVVDISANKNYENIYELWLKPDPYKHRLMRICGVPEFYITGDAEPYEKFLKFCSVFPIRRYLGFPLCLPKIMRNIYGMKLMKSFVHPNFHRLGY